MQQHTYLCTSVGYLVVTKLDGGGGGATEDEEEEEEETNISTDGLSHVLTYLSHLYLCRK